ncbi:MAG: chalcone isomerase family protein [Hylemonella sp.]
MRLPIASFLLVLSLFTQSKAASLEGLSFDDQVRLGGSELKLNGLGVRGIFIFKAYVAGLYLPVKTSQSHEALMQKGPKRLQLRMLMEVGAEDIRKALVDGMRKNVTDTQWSLMQERVNRFSSTILELGNAQRGDTITLDYLPAQGLLLSVNEVSKGRAIAGSDFYNALLAIFIGDDPVDTRLRNGLLGL